MSTAISDISPYALAYVPSFAPLPPHLGSKACMLGWLSSHSAELGYTVPPAFVIPPDPLSEFLPLVFGPQQAPSSEYRSIVETQDLERSHICRQRVELVELPVTLISSLRDRYSALVDGADTDLVAVRSSFHAEDDATVSFAGIFESILSVSGVDMLTRAVRSVYASMFSQRTIRYLHATTKAAIPSMSIIVQRMVSSDRGFSGVAYSRAPDLPGSDLMLLAASPISTGVTSGDTVPEEYLLYRPNLATGQSPILQFNAGTSTASRGYCFSQESIRRLSTILIELEHRLARPIEIEWAISSDGEIYLLQARPAPISRLQDPPLRSTYSARPLVRGLAVGHGQITGVVRRTNSIEEAEHLGPEHILVTELTNPDWEATLSTVGALVTQSGGRTSHAARLSRERGKLAIVGCGKQIQHLNTGDEITMVCSDGLEGAIYPAITQPDATSPQTDPEFRILITNPHDAFTIARRQSAQTVEVDLSYLRRALRIREELLEPAAEVPLRIRRRIAGYGSVAHFLQSKFREAIALVYVAFPDSSIVVRHFTNSSSPDPFDALLDSAVSELNDRFGFYVATEPRT